jgi:hypothetical protein
VAKARGGSFGRPVKKPPENFPYLVMQWERKNLPVAELLAQLGLKEATFYRRLRKIRLSRKK